MGLEGFAPKSASFKAKLIGGRVVKITLRPFTLADTAWFQNDLTEQDHIEIAEMKVSAVCKALWHMMDKESKDIFCNISFVHYDEVEKTEIKTQVTGYEKLVHSFADETAILNGIEALAECKGLNGFIEESKKKMNLGA